tara:strand:- start:135 stop:338 length:204 start_codon:yes stop_codon:yes gene_type:complete
LLPATVRWARGALRRFRVDLIMLFVAALVELGGALELPLLVPGLYLIGYVLYRTFLILAAQGTRFAL